MIRLNIAESILSFLAKKEVYGLAIIILVSIIVYRLGTKLIEKIIIKGKDAYERKKRKTIVNLISNIFKYAVFILAVLFILGLYGVDTKALIASFGVVGAVLGLALQDTIKDFISGITIIMDNYFVVGDIVTFNDFTGEVIDMGLKTTKIKKHNGEVLVVANRNIDAIINISQKPANIVIDIPTAYEEKTTKVEKTIEKIMTEILKIEGVKKDSKYLGISSLNDSCVNYSISILCPQDNQWQIKRDALKIIKTIYEKEKIKIPYPQIEVHHEQKI